MEVNSQLRAGCSWSALGDRMTWASLLKMLLAYVPLWFKDIFVHACDDVSTGEMTFQNF